MNDTVMRQLKPYACHHQHCSARRCEKLDPRITVLTKAYSRQRKSPLEIALDLKIGIGMVVQYQRAAGINA